MKRHTQTIKLFSEVLNGEFFSLPTGSVIYERKDIGYKNAVGTYKNGNIQEICFGENTKVKIVNNNSKDVIKNNFSKKEVKYIFKLAIDYCTNCIEDIPYEKPINF